MKKKGLFLLPIMCLFLFNICWAEAPATAPSKEFEVYNLGEIVVSAENANVKEVAVVNEITAEDIKATNSKTLAEALSYAPGVRVTSGAKNEPNVSIHGFGQNQILILIDGVPYYETKYGKLDLNQIPTDNIAKIEITKGAASVLYGPNALGGVINVITKKPSDKPYTSASMEFGNYEAQRYSFTHGMKKGIFNYWLNYNYAKSNGYRLSEDFEPTPTTIVRKPGGTTKAVLQEKGERVNSASESNNIWAKFGIEPKEGSEYYLNFHYLTKEKAWPISTNTMTAFLTRPYFTQFARYSDYTDWGLDFDAKQKVHDKVTLKAKLFYHHHQDVMDSYADQTYSTPLAKSTYKDYILGSSLFADIKPVNWDVLRFAVHYKNDNHRQRDDEYLPFEESASYTGSVAVENEFNLVKNLSVVTGVSYDWFFVDKAEASQLVKATGNFISMTEKSKTNSHSLNPMAGLTYTFPDATKIYGSVAHKSRFPNLSELYSSTGGNVDLETEESWNYTVGVSRPISTFAKAGLSFFYYDVSNMITRDAPPPIATYVNYGKVQLAGVEVNAEVYPIDGLILRVDYTYENARNQNDGRVTDNVPDIPNHKVDFGIQYQVPVVKTKLNFSMIYISSTYSQLPTQASPLTPELMASDYTIFDVKITQPIWKYFEAYVACKNIFDKNYEPEVGYPNPGRNFWVGLSAKF